MTRAAPARLLLVVLVTAAVGLVAALARSTSDVAVALPGFCLAVGLVVYVPGRTLLSLSGLTPAPIEHLTLSLALGIPASSLAYWLCGYLGVRWAFWVFVALALSVCLTVAPFRWRALFAARQVRYSHVLLALVILLACAPFAASPFHFRTLAPTPAGGLTFFAEVDPVFHVAVATELQHEIPPQIPFMPGHRLSYHYGIDLLAAMLASTGLDVAAVTLRYLPVLLMIFSVLASYGCARAWLGSETAAVLAAFLVILGEDWSFVPGLLLQCQQSWVTYFSQMPTSLSLYMLNPMLPAIGFLMSALLCLSRYFGGAGRAWLGIAIVAGATLVEYKVFTAGHLLAGLAVTALVYAFRFRLLGPLWALALLALATAPLLLAAASVNAGLISVRLAPSSYVRDAFQHMGLPLPALFEPGASLSSGLLVPGFVFGLGLSVYLLLALGARAVGLRAWAGTLLHPDPAGAGRFLVAVLVLIGPLASLLLSITVAGYVPGRSASPNYNNAVWFLVQSKYLLWLFALEGLQGWARGRRSRVLLGALLLVALSIPATVQTFFLQRTARLAVVGPPAVALLEFMRREVPPGSVCLAREDMAPLLLVLTRCRTLAFDLYNFAFVSSAELHGLERNYRRFWDHWPSLGRSASAREGAALAESLFALRVDYVVAETDSAPADVALEEGAGTLLQRRFGNRRFVVYEVRPHPERSGDTR